MIRIVNLRSKNDSFSKNTYQILFSRIITIIFLSKLSILKTNLEQIA